MVLDKGDCSTKREIKIFALFLAIFLGGLFSAVGNSAIFRGDESNERQSDQGNCRGLCPSAVVCTESRLEPQLARIADELEVIRKSGGIMAGSGNSVENQTAENAVMVYYFHGNTRCPTCRSIESQAHAIVTSDFASQLESGQVIWKILNYEKPEGTELGKIFGIQMPVVVVVQMNKGQIEDWKRLDEVWALVGDQSDFAKLIRTEINQKLEALGTDLTSPSISSPIDTTISGNDLSDIPLPVAVDEPTSLPNQDDSSAVPGPNDPQSSPDGDQSNPLSQTQIPTTFWYQMDRRIVPI